MTLLSFQKHIYDEITSLWSQFLVCAFCTKYYRWLWEMRRRTVWNRLRFYRLYQNFVRLYQNMRKMFSILEERDWKKTLLVGWIGLTARSKILIFTSFSRFRSSRRLEIEFAGEGFFDVYDHSHKILSTLHFRLIFSIILCAFHIHINSFGPLVTTYPVLYTVLIYIFSIIS